MQTDSTLLKTVFFCGVSSLYVFNCRSRWYWKETYCIPLQLYWWNGS